VNVEKTRLVSPPIVGFGDEEAGPPSDGGATMGIATSSNGCTSAVTGSAVQCSAAIACAHKMTEP
jgi:hypothetical protein